MRLPLPSWSRPSFAVLLLLAGVATAAPSAAPLPTFDLERMAVMPTSSYSLLGSTGALLEPGTLRLAVVTHYERNPLVVVRDGRRVGELVRNRSLVHLGAAFAPYERVELGASVPLLVDQGGMELAQLGMGQLPSSGLGTPLLRARVGVLREEDGALVDLSAELDAGLPLGNREALLGDARWSFHPRVALGRTFDRMRLSLEAGARVRERVEVGSHVVGSELPFALGVMNTDGRLRGELSLRAAMPLGRGGLWSGEVLAGARYLFSPRFELFALGGPGLGVAPGVPAFRVLAGVGFDPLPPALLKGETPPAVGPTGSATDGTPTDAVAVVDEAPEPEDGAAPPEPEVVVEPLDTDEDLVADAVDNCPREPGVPSNAGCPEESQQVVFLTSNRIEITQKVFFAFARAEVLPRSYPLMDQVAQVLLNHPELGHIVVEGHTDNIGGAEYNRRLSQARAESVCHELERRGVQPSRLTAQGFGPDHPADTNRTAAGRERNRRVEFRIVDPTQEPTESAQETTP